MLKRFAVFALGVFALAIASVSDRPALAEKDEIYTGFFSNLAVDGYDVVAYFTQGKPVKGDKSYSFDYKGATWRFSSEENLEAFKADPEKYAPQYGGYCAWAMVRGEFASAEPDNWTIVDGKLYLNYSDSVQEKWEKDIPNYIAKADEHWPEVLKK